MRVIDRAPIEAGHRASPRCRRTSWPTRRLTDEALTVGVGFALLAGFVDDLQVRPVDEGIGTEVRMVWPVAALTGVTPSATC